MHRIMMAWSTVWRGWRYDEFIVCGLCVCIMVYCAGINYSRSSKPAATYFENVPTSTAYKADKQRNTATVHIAGQVHHPGVYILPSGARVGDALRKAGGVLHGAETGSLNLAGIIEDGSRILVLSRKKRYLTAAKHSSAGADLTVRTVNLNTASQLELESLPGIGPSLAQRIVAHRQQQGKLKSISDLDAVKGIGPKKIDELKNYISF